MDPEIASLVNKTLLGLTFGVLYGLYGFVTKRDPGEPFKTRKLLRTVVLWGAAGVVVAVADGTSALERGEIEKEVASVAVLGVAFDHAWAAARRSGWIPNSATEIGGDEE